MKQGKINDDAYLIEGLMRAYTFDRKENEVIRLRRTIIYHPSWALNLAVEMPG